MSYEVIGAIKFKKYVLSLDLQCREVFLASCVQRAHAGSPLCHWFSSLLTIVQGDESKDALLDYHLWSELFDVHCSNSEFRMIVSRI
jgi:hypothetical protein